MMASAIEMPTVSDHVEIQKTKDYEKFRLPSWNREVSERRAQRMSDRAHLLRFSPILVQPDDSREDGFVVMDGQHRLTACKTAGVPVYFVVDWDCEMTIEDVQKLNHDQSSWSISDFIDSYFDRGVPSYKYVKELQNRFGLPETSVRVAVKVGSTGYAPKQIKNGQLEIYKPEKIEKFIGWLQNFEGLVDYWKTYRFVDALVMLYMCPLVDNDRLLDRAHSYTGMIGKRAATYDQVENLLAVYNYRTRTEDCVSLLEIKKYRNRQSGKGPKNKALADSDVTPVYRGWRGAQ